MRTLHIAGSCDSFHLSTSPGLLIRPLFAVLTWNSGLSLDSRDTRDSHLPSFHLVRCGVLSSLILSVARGKDLALVFVRVDSSPEIQHRTFIWLTSHRSQ